MDNRQENRERDERLEKRIEEMMANPHARQADGTYAEQVARAFARMASEESPRMSNAARTQGIHMLRARAAQKRAARRPDAFAFLRTLPRWAQMLGVALVVVLIVNGISTVAADSLPGSLLYPFKRFGEGGQLLLQNTNAQRAQVWMNLANTRLDEVQRLLRNGAPVDPSALDAVDESILRVLAELAGTRGDERVDLLKKLTALAIRQQQIVNQLAQHASNADRARLEQTAKLLEGVASYAQSTDAVAGPDISPFQFLTPSATPPNSPTAIPSATPTVTPQPTFAPTNLPPSPSAVPALNDNNTANDNDNRAGDNDNSISNDNDDDDKVNDNADDDSNSNDNDDDDNANDNSNADANNDDVRSGDDKSDDTSGSGSVDDRSGGGNDNQDNENGDDDSGQNTHDDDKSGGHDNNGGSDDGKGGKDDSGGHGGGGKNDRDDD